MRWAMVLAALLAAPGLAEGKGVRFFGSTQIRYVQLRELDLQTVDIDELEGEGLVRRLPDGRWITCAPGDTTCSYFATGDGIYAAPVVQDLRASGWSDGGLRVYAHARARTGLGPNRELWPFSDEELDLLSGYVEWSRPKLRLRGGRQFHLSGLGVFNFDGGAARVQPRSWVALEAYGGRSLARGLQEGRDGDLLSSLEEFAPDDGAYLAGGAATFRHGRQGRLRLEYLREAFSGGDDLVGERFAGDLTYEKRGLRWMGSIERDLSTDEWNELHMRLRLPPWRGASLFVDARHYHPYFELWTIWNAFSPVGYDEVGGGVTWSSSSAPVQLAAQAASRKYEDTDAGVQFAPVRDDGWRLSLDGAWRMQPAWSLQAGYRADFGPGETRSEGSVRLGHDPNSPWSLGLMVQAIQFVREFRVAGSNIYGAGIDASYELAADARVTVGFSHYRHAEDDRLDALDFGQSRGFVRFDWAWGDDPGMRRTP